MELMYNDEFTKMLLCSELAVYIEDEEHVPSMMNDQPYNAGRFARHLRLRLFREHLGIDEDEEHLIQDPLSERFFRNVWIERASQNTLFYRDLFRCYPDDTVTNWETYQQFVDTPGRPPAGHVVSLASPEYVREKIDEIQGNLVMHPLRFLCDENLGAVFPAKEFMIPMEVFV